MATTKKTTKKEPAKKATAAKKAPAKKAAGAKASSKSAKGEGRSNPLQQPVQPDDVLAAALGVEKPLPRTDITKRLWDYIKQNQLQDPNDKRTIIADDKLRPLFGKKKVTMFEMTKIVNQHVQ